MDFFKSPVDFNFCFLTMQLCMVVLTAVQNHKVEFKCGKQLVEDGETGI